MILEIADVMAVVKGIDIGGDSEGLIVDNTAAPSTAVTLLPPVVKLVDIVVANVVDSATKKFVRSLVAAVVVDDCVAVVGIAGPVTVVETIARIVVATVAAAVVVVRFTGASVGMYGNFGQGLLICGPSIESKT